MCIILLRFCICILIVVCCLERNLDLGQSLVNLRKETQQNFDNALRVQNQFSLVEKQLKDLDQVSLYPFLLLFIQLMHFVCLEIVTEFFIDET